jgi:hypothetical protein
VLRVTGSNGTRINDKAYGPDKTTVLNHGDRIAPIVQDSDRLRDRRALFVRAQPGQRDHPDPEPEIRRRFVMGTCPHCGTANSDDASFCAECGKRMAETGTAAGMQTISAMETIASLPTSRGRGDDHVELAPGEEFANRYVIDRVIGKGGMGVVYRAQDKLIDKPIALKLIRRDRLGGEGAIKRLINEGVTTRDVRHNNVVAVYDVGEADGSPFVSMEYIEAIRCATGTASRSRSARRAAAGRRAHRHRGPCRLEAAHAKGVIHRDLKPEKILLTERPDLRTGAAQDRRFRHRPRRRRRRDRERHRHRARHAALHGAGADHQCRQRRRIRRPLFDLDHLLRAARRRPAPGPLAAAVGRRSDIPVAVDKLIERAFQPRRQPPQSAAEYRQQLEQAVRGYMPSRAARCAGAGGAPATGNC